MYKCQGLLLLEQAACRLSSQRPQWKSSLRNLRTMTQPSVQAYDIVFIGSGFTCLGVAYAIHKKDPSLKLAFISREEKPGGIWIGAASIVKLHQQTYYYALPGIPHDDPDCHLNAMHQASSEQVRSYAATVARHLGCRHIPTDAPRGSPPQLHPLCEVSNKF